MTQLAHTITHTISNNNNNKKKYLQKKPNIFCVSKGAAALSWQKHTQIEFLFCGCYKT